MYLAWCRNVLRSSEEKTDPPELTRSSRLATSKVSYRAQVILLYLHTALPSVCTCVHPIPTAPPHPPSPYQNIQVTPLLASSMKHSKHSVLWLTFLYSMTNSASCLASILRLSLRGSLWLGTMTENGALRLAEAFFKNFTTISTLCRQNIKYRVL